MLRLLVIVGFIAKLDVQVRGSPADRIIYTGEERKPLACRHLRQHSVGDDLGGGFVLGGSLNYRCKLFVVGGLLLAGCRLRVVLESGDYLLHSSEDCVPVGDQLVVAALEDIIIAEAQLTDRLGASHHHVILIARPELLEALGTLGVGGLSLEQEPQKVLPLIVWLVCLHWQVHLRLQVF